jgi:hypothetical protein
MMFNTDGNKLLCSKKAKDMAIVTYKQLRYGQQAIIEKWI